MDTAPESTKTEQNQGGATDLTPPEASRVPVGEELLRDLILNLEYIFSRDYLSSDPILVSQLDADCNIPIKLIEEHPLVKSLTSDSALILKALSSSQHITLDADRQLARPADKPVLRNTLILRDIPSTTSEEAIRALFLGVPTLLTDVVEMKNEIGNTYFIKFKTEDSALEAFKHLRTQKFNDQPVQARIKSENLLRSAYYLDPAIQQHYGQQSAAAINNPYSQQYNYKGHGGYEGENGYGRGRFNRRGKKDGQVNDERKGGRGRFAKRGSGPNQPNNSGKTIRPNQSASLAQWWPPLPSGEGVDAIGYTTDFKKYSKEQLVQIITAVGPTAPKPHWTATNPEANRPEGDTINILDLTKPMPKDAKIDWVEARRKHSRSTGAKQPNKTNTETKWASLLQNGKQPS